MRRILRQIVVVTATTALLLGGGTAFAQTQPANLGNVLGADRGASAPGPHCHFVLPAQGNAGFGNIISGAAHQAHVQTGTPTGVFEATDCPGS
ncbi:MAG: hypothetical protein M3253_07005 [Chloroflexota bacterium]|nr:hypothetical protein [Chloroflexota bacterium]